MTSENKLRLALLAIIELVLIGGGIALFMIGQATAAILLVVIGVGITSVLMVMLVLKGRPPVANQHDGEER